MRTTKELTTRVVSIPSDRALGSTAAGNEVITALLFLDFDGVLNTPATWGKRPLATDAMDADKVQRLSDLCEREDCHVVISSSWRYIYNFDPIEFGKMLGALGFKSPSRVIGCTGSPPTTDADRGDEISWWMKDWSTRPPFVILDDMGLEQFEGLGYHLVQTRGSIGLTDQDCKHASRSLARQRSEQAQSVDAIDPHVADPGTLTTRVGESSFSPAQTQTPPPTKDG